jgi:cupin superfamily acireductone dioxygenase involved in methionine salvage
MVSAAKVRAQKRGLAFNITKIDIIIPEVCPVLGIPLKHNSRHMGDSSPTIDRIDNSRGYTRDNIVIISMKANRLKSNATLEEIQQIAEFYKKFQKKEKKFLTFLKNMVYLKK